MGLGTLNCIVSILSLVQSLGWMVFTVLTIILYIQVLLESFDNHNCLPEFIIACLIALLVYFFLHFFCFILSIFFLSRRNPKTYVGYRILVCTISSWSTLTLVLCIADLFVAIPGFFSPIAFNGVFGLIFIRFGFLWLYNFIIGLCFLINSLFLNKVFGFTFVEGSKIEIYAPQPSQPQIQTHPDFKHSGWLDYSQEEKIASNKSLTKEDTLMACTDEDNSNFGSIYSTSCVKLSDAYGHSSEDPKFSNTNHPLSEEKYLSHTGLNLKLFEQGQRKIKPSIKKQDNIPTPPALPNQGSCQC